MKILVLSDLHLEFHADHGRSFIDCLPTGDKVDVCVLAGDITVGEGIPNALKQFCDRYEQVIFTFGNHEFYNSNRNSVISWTLDAVAANSNLTWLDCDTKVIGGKRFVGTPMWFRDAPDNKRWTDCMNDFQVIEGFADWVYKENERALKYLEKNVQKGDIVVTHYLPSWKSVAPQFKDSNLNRFFVCDVEPLIRKKKPALFTHGHTHSSFDYLIGKTRVVANPFGYARYEENAKFLFDKIVEVP